MKMAPDTNGMPASRLGDVGAASGRAVRAGFAVSGSIPGRALPRFVYRLSGEIPVAR